MLSMRRELVILPYNSATFFAGKLKVVYQMHGQFESLVPLLMFHEHLGPQDAMERGAGMLHESYRRFNEAEQLLYKDVDPDSLGVTKSYVRACKDLIVCNLHWRYEKRKAFPGALGTWGDWFADVF